MLSLKISGVTLPLYFCYIKIFRNILQYINTVNNLKLYEFNFSLHVELELEVSTLDKFNYHQCQFLTLNSQIGCFYYQGGREVGREWESIIYSARVVTVRNGKIVILLMDINYHDNQSGVGLTPITRSLLLC